MCSRYFFLGQIPRKKIDKSKNTHTDQPLLTCMENVAVWLGPSRIYILKPLIYSVFQDETVFKDRAFKREINLLIKRDCYRGPKSTVTCTLIRQRSLDVQRHEQCAHRGQRPCKERTSVWKPGRKPREKTAY